MISTIMLFYLILLLIYVVQIDSELDSCRQTFGSNKYDLNQLSHLTILGEDLGYKYALTPCGLVPTDQCGQHPFPLDPGMTACQQNKAILRFESAMGFLDGYGKSPNIEFSENDDGPGTGVIMTMRNAICGANERLVNVIFICDKSVEKPTNMDVKEDPPCTFTIKVRAAGACPTGGSIFGGGITGGAVFVIILLVLIVVYVVGGVLYNRFKNQEKGLALLPHPSFWVLLFGLFRDGCKTTWNFVSSCGQSKGSYNSV
jgi:hypothetical protein